MQEDSTTRQPDARPEGDEGRRRRVLALTVLSHPLPARIGQRAFLKPLKKGGAVELGRRAPEFTSPDSPWDREPLEDPFISRQPWCLEPRPHGGLTLYRASSTTELRVDEEPVAEHLDLDTAPVCQCR